MAMPSAKPVVDLNDANFADWAEKKMPLTLVLVRSAACAQSLALEPMLADVRKQYSGKVRVATLDMDRSPRTVKRHKVDGLPTMLLLRDGKQIGALRGCAVSVAAIGDFIAESERAAPEG
jgi:thioredoxin-like negative regulator of GroEL